MKTAFRIFTLVLSVSFFSCAKSNDTPAISSTATTALQVTTTDNVGNKLTGATVILYASQADMTGKIHPVKTGLTDAQGSILFDSLNDLQYYWSATMDCESNANGTCSTTTPINAHTRNMKTSVLAGTGTLTYVNNTINPYTVYVNGVPMAKCAGQTTTQSINMPVGNYSIRIVQTSGYTDHPADKTYTGVLSCGSNISVTFVTGEI